jgi:hypothetical protein
MFESLARWSGRGAAVAALMALAACSRSAPAEAPPSPPTVSMAAPPLAGGPPPDAVLADARRTPPPVAIPGRRVPTQAELLWMQRHRWSPAPADSLVISVNARGVEVISMRPVPNPEAPDFVNVSRRWAHQDRSGLAARPLAAQQRKDALPHPVLVRPHATAARRPAPAPHAPLALSLIGAPTAGASSSATDAALDGLTAAVAATMKTVTLSVPPDLSAGRPAKVVLTLPADLLESIRAKAAGVGLEGAARRTDVVIVLSGRGYAITPGGEQSAPLKLGEPAVFSWTVQPSNAPGGVLTADMTGALYGGESAATFALGAVTAQVSAAQAAPVNPPAPVRAGTRFLGETLPDLSKLDLGALKLPDLGKFKLPDLNQFHLQDLAIPGHKTIDLPGLGPVASEKVVTVGILAVILILLMLIARNARQRRLKAERRRRFHSFEATAFADEPAAEAPAHGHH